MSSSLLLLQRHYAALSPTTASLIPSPPFPTSRDLSAPQTQQWLVDNLLSSDGDEEPSGQAWKKVFWRRVVKGIEEGFQERRNEGDAEVEEEEVHETILEELVKHLSSSSAPSERLARSYYWGPLAAGAEGWSRVQTTEEGRMISAGTTGLRTWQACISLSNHLIASPSLLAPSPSASPPTILELGAGVGLLSLVAGRLAPDDARLVATDVDEKVLQQLEENVELNDLQSKVKTRKLDWELSARLDEPAVKEELEEWERAAFGEAGRASLILEPTL
ncbi:hypothetical protein BCR35DRAFT_94231 [Leucosporidium creatinivorum]|uniref:Methyltransferase-domain-containing protein n=1 Tax=Leucosporidium creatinivorum TaxID=106004 RepID=A0A1Y2F8E5_9BASI|nr:hypothetical protein BCR35DRAFT_94231 [Leucosporidium creatinivorum]